MKTRGPRWPCIFHLITRQVWVKWPSVYEKKVQYWFLRWLPSLISSQNDFSLFWSTSRSIFPMKFVNCPFGSGEKVQNRFSTWLGCPIRMTSAIFNLQVTPILPIKFRVNGAFISGDEVQKKKKRFSRWQQWRHLVFPIGTILAIFDLQVTSMNLTKFQVNWPFGSGKEAKHRFSRWLPWWNNFRYIWSTSHSKASYPGLNQLAFRLRRRNEKQIFKIDPWRPSWISDRTILLFPFFFWSTSHSDASHRVNWPYGSGEDSKNRFSRWRPWRPSCVSDRNYLSCFYLQVALILPTKFQVQEPFGSGEEAKNRFSRWPSLPPSWISDRTEFSYFWSISHPDASYLISSQLSFRFRRRSEK